MSNVGVCENTRQLTANFVENTLKYHFDISETKFTDKLKAQLAANKNLYDHGWYEPPPYGIAVLFSDKNNFKRLQYDTLRKEEYWPRAKNKFGREEVGLIYLSPVDKKTGVIGDFGTSIYVGADEKIQSHFKKCLVALEKVTEYAEVGMEFRDIHDYAQKQFKDSGLNNDRTVTWTDNVRTNLGHTIPFTYEKLTKSEQEVIDSGDFSHVKDLISSKRVNVNKVENFKIPATIAFTNEVRLEDSNDPNIPLLFFHLVILFNDGRKEIRSNFNLIFKTLGMDKFVSSKYG